MIADSAGRERSAMWLLAGLWAAAPLYPSFIALMPIAPPGVVLLPAHVAFALLLAVCAATLLLGLLLLAEVGFVGFRARLPWVGVTYLGVMLLASLCGRVPLVGLFSVLCIGCGGIGALAINHWGARPRVAAAMRRALVISALLASLLALSLWILHRPIALYVVGNGRAIGGFVVPGELAGYLGMLLPYSIGVALTTTRYERWFTWGACLVEAATLAASGSRAGLLGVAFALVLYAASYGRRALLLVSVVLVGGLASLAAFIAAHHNPAEDTVRLAIWQAALRVAALFPLLGVGPGGFAVLYPLVRLPQSAAAAYHPHNVLLLALTETGLLGLAALLLLWGRFVQLFLRGYRRASPFGRRLGLAIMVGFIATWIESSVDVVQTLLLGLWTPFMALALLSLTLVACTNSAMTQRTVISPTPIVTPRSTPSPTFPPVVVRAQRQGHEPVRILVVEHGRPRYRVLANADISERRADGSYRSRLIAPQVSFYNRDGSQMHIRSEYASLDGATKSVTMEGHVVATAQDGTVLLADRLHYNDRTEMLEGWGGILITTPQGDRLHGEHVLGDIRLGHLRIDEGAGL